MAENGNYEFIHIESYHLILQFCLRRNEVFHSKEGPPRDGIAGGQRVMHVWKRDDREGSRRPEAGPDIWLLTFSPRG